MPRLARIGSASDGSFGFTSGGVPAFIAVDYLVVGAGGAGGSGACYGGGGGGAMVPSNTTLGTKSNYSVTAGSFPGGSSSFNGTNANGGGTGGDLVFNTTGGDGGASGNGNGGGGGLYVYYAPGYGDAYGGGGGGGSAGGGGNAHTDAPYGYYTYGGDGGNGATWSIDGKTYGGGGGGWWYDSTSGDRPGSSGSNTGDFGRGDERGSGQSGGVIISYVYPTQLFTGGAVTSTGSGITKRWFHSFSSNGTLAHIY